MKGLPVFRPLDFLAVASSHPWVRAGEDAKAAPPKWYDTFEIHGLVDTYYSATIGQSQADATIRRSTPRTASSSHTAGPAWSPTPPPSTSASARRRRSQHGDPGTVGASPILPQQAYVSLKLPADIVLDAGKFVTNTGAEVIEAKDNWMYSRSILFGWAIPFTHTGVRATVPVPGAEGVSVMGSVFNGFDNPPLAVGSKKMGHLALMYSGPSSTLVVLTPYGYAPTDADERLCSTRSWPARRPLSVNLNADYGKRGDLPQGSPMVQRSSRRQVPPERGEY
jgi:hypothetical protein